MIKTSKALKRGKKTRRNGVKKTSKALKQWIEISERSRLGEFDRMINKWSKMWNRLSFVFQSRCNQKWKL